MSETKITPVSSTSPARSIGSLLSLAAAVFTLSSGEVESQAALPTGNSIAEKPTTDHSPRAAAKPAMQVETVRDVINKFDPGVHVYYQQGFFGNTGIPYDQIQSLANRLGKTDYYLVVLSDSPYNLETGAYLPLGQDLFTNPKFAAITDSRLGEPMKSASLFVLSVDKRDWWWRASNLHEKMNLSDEETFKDGGRFGVVVGTKNRPGYFSRKEFEDGVMATVDAIESELKQNIQIELRTREQAQNNVTTLRGNITTLDDRLSALQGKYPGRNGEIFSSSILERGQSSLQMAETALGNKNFVSARNLATREIPSLQRRVAQIARYELDDKRLSDTAATLGGFSQNEFYFLASESVKAAQATLETAKTCWERGDEEYISHLDSAIGLANKVSNDLRDGASTYRSHGAKIDKIKSDLDTARESKFAPQLKEKMDLLSSSLAEVGELWRDKNSHYPQKLEESQSKLGEIHSDIVKLQGEEDSRNLRNRLFQILIGVLGAIGLGVAGRKIKGNLEIQRQAKEKLERISQAFEEREESLGLLEALQEKALIKFGSVVSFKDGGTTADAAEAGKNALSKLQLLQVAVHEEILGQANKLANSNRFYTPDGYSAALEILSTKPVKFSDENRDQLELALGAKRRGLDALTVPIDQLGQFSMSLKDIDAEARELAETARANFEGIIAARELVTTEANEIREAIKEVGGSLEKLATSCRECPTHGSKFDLSEVGSAFLKDAESFLTKAEGSAELDPIDSANELTQIKSALKEFVNIIKRSTNFTTEALKSIETGERGLKESGIATGWIDAFTSEFSNKLKDRVNTIFADKKTPEDSSKIAELSKVASEFLEKFNLVIHLNDIRIRNIPEDLATTKTLVTKTRETISELTGVSESICLVEEGSDPKEYFAALDTASKELAKALSNFDTENAQSEANKAASALDAIQEICDASTKEASAYTKNLAEINVGVSQAKESLPKFKATLEGLTKKYADACFKLGAEDPDFPDDDGVAHNNISEIDSALEKIGAALDRADLAFKAAKPIEAGVHLDSCRANLEFIENREKEIESKESSLKHAEEEVVKLRASLDEVSGNVNKDAKDYRVTEATLSLLNRAIRDAEQAEKDIASVKGKRNPFDERAKLSSALATFKRIEKEIKEDLAEHSEAVSSVAVAHQAITRAAKLSRKLDGDDIPDSTDLDSTQDLIIKLTTQAAGLESQLNRKTRLEWREIDIEADNIAAQVERCIHELDAEEAAGQEAVARIRSAMSQVREASSWSGSYGVSISGSPGSSELTRARNLLQSGDYSEAEKIAQRAIREAESAISEAEAEVSRIRRRKEEEAERQRAEERRREEEREARNRRSSSGGSSYGSSWGNSSGGSSFGSSWGSSSGGSSSGGW